MPRRKRSEKKKARPFTTPELFDLLGIKDHRLPTRLRTERTLTATLVRGRLEWDRGPAEKLKDQIDRDAKRLTLSQVAEKLDVTYSGVRKLIRLGRKNDQGKRIKLDAKTVLHRAAYGRLMPTETVSPEDLETFLRESNFDARALPLGVELKPGEITTMQATSKYPGFTRETWVYWCTVHCGALGRKLPSRTATSALNGQTVYVLDDANAADVVKRTRNQSGVFMLTADGREPGKDKNGDPEPAEEWVADQVASERCSSPAFPVTARDIRRLREKKQIRAVRRGYAVPSGRWDSRTWLSPLVDSQRWALGERSRIAIHNRDHDERDRVLGLLAQLDGDNAAREQVPAEPGRLTLEFDSETRVLKRPGWGAVDFGGRDLLWRLAEFLYRAGSAYRSAKHLQNHVWNPDGTGKDPSDAAIRVGMRDLRAMVVTIGVKTEWKRGRGWRLVRA